MLIRYIDDLSNSIINKPVSFETFSFVHHNLCKSAVRKGGKQTRLAHVQSGKPWNLTTKAGIYNLYSKSWGSSEKQRRESVCDSWNSWFRYESPRFYILSCKYWSPIACFTLLSSTTTFRDPIFPIGSLLVQRPVAGGSPPNPYDTNQDHDQKLKSACPWGRDSIAGFGRKHLLFNHHIRLMR